MLLCLYVHSLIFKKQWISNKLNMVHRECEPTPQLPMLGEKFMALFKLTEINFFAFNSELKESSKWFCMIVFYNLVHTPCRVCYFKFILSNLIILFLFLTEIMYNVLLSNVKRRNTRISPRFI